MGKTDSPDKVIRRNPYFVTVYSVDATYLSLTNVYKFKDTYPCGYIPKTKSLILARQKVRALILNKRLS